MLKIGVVGLQRGICFPPCFEANKDVYVTAFCDTDEELLKKIKEERKDALTFTRYEDFLESDIDAVVVAVPVPLHCEFSIAALEKGKHVLCEVCPVNSLEEAKKLIEVVKKTKKKYMLAENSCYLPYLQSWKEIVKKGYIGKIMYAEGEYIHNCEDLVRSNIKAGRPWRATLPPLYYSTHEMGPLLSIMEDRCVLAQGFMTDETLDFPGVKNPAPRQEVGIFKTEKGAVIKILVAFGIKRPSCFHYYSIYGTKGCLETDRIEEKKIFGFFEDIPYLGGMATLPLATTYNIQTAGTHGGTEYFLVKEFVESILFDKPVPIGIERAMDFALPGLYAHQSAMNNGGVIKIETF